MRIGATLVSFALVLTVVCSAPARAGEWRADKLEDKTLTVLCANNSPQLRRWQLMPDTYEVFKKDHLNGMLQSGWSIMESTSTTAMPLKGELIVSIIYEDWRPRPTKMVKKSVDVKGRRIHLVFERRRYQYGANEKRPKVWVHQVVVAEDFTVGHLETGEYDVFLNDKPIGRLRLLAP